MKYKAQIIPWIAGDSGFWGGVNLKNQSAAETTVRIVESNEQGGVMSTRDVKIGPWKNHNWSVAANVRTILIEGSDFVFVTANQGQVGSPAMTSLPVYEVPYLKN